ncbi:phosphohistidine phosphatase [Polystyrenella longa]|uniref:Phosphohistidine phosphatase n=1 Tax=Polystyrenella longa TaxID=2528007 RepID=A0A518CLS7_9PLAN|nr:histidine phosphatase family protein [Polystyrenella longa]QDU80186.1 phosphohistidine phosphatase [Polystyrenella longa]
MKTLLLMRHSKSSWDNPADQDIERPLNSRGKREATLMGKHLVNEGLEPDMIVCSNAKRARRTAEKVIKAMDWNGPLEVNPDLYFSSVISYVDVLNQQLDKHDRVLLIGHNPIIEDFLSTFTGGWREAKTSTVAQLKIDIKSWSDLSHNTKARLKNFWIPAMLEK